MRFPYGYPGPVAYESREAKLGELVPVDPTAGSITITLPKFYADDQGRCVTVVNVTSSTNAITLLPEDGTVCGSASVALGAAWLMLQVLALDASAQAWVLMGVCA